VLYNNTLSQKKEKEKRGWRWSSVVKCLSSVHKALDLISSTAPKKKSVGERILSKYIIVCMEVSQLKSSTCTIKIC
jgi:hypothetical protein